jgi:glycosyltransferase involved in cell wall biosynthesis
LAVTITAIVCAYNEARHLPACLHSFWRKPAPDEILVINNASTDETADVARAIPVCASSTSPSRASS